MLTIKELLNDLSMKEEALDETALAGISDWLWGMGSLEEIKEKVSPDLFLLHVGMNVIGNWKGDGWWSVICEQADLVPYIPEALGGLHLPQLKQAFEDVISIFPEYTVFKSDDAAYYDICNFLQNARFKVEDERLNQIAPEKRKEMVAQVKRNLDRLEDLTKPLWRDSAECEGWKQVIDFIKENMQ